MSRQKKVVQRGHARASFEGGQQKPELMGEDSDDQPCTRMDLLEFQLVVGDRVALKVKNHKTSAGSALVNGGNKCGHLGRGSLKRRQDAGSTAGYRRRLH